MLVEIEVLVNDIERYNRRIEQKSHPLRKAIKRVVKPTVIVVVNLTAVALCGNVNGKRQWITISFDGPTQRFNWELFEGNKDMSGFKCKLDIPQDLLR